MRERECERSLKVTDVCVFIFGALMNMGKHISCCNAIFSYFLAPLMYQFIAQNHYRAEKEHLFSLINCLQTKNKQNIPKNTKARQACHPLHHQNFHSPLSYKSKQCKKTIFKIHKCFMDLCFAQHPLQLIQGQHS